MPVCSGCLQGVKKTQFSKSQLSKISTKRRCKKCVSDGVSAVSSVESTASREEESISDKEAFDDMFRWLKDGGSRFDSVKVDHFSRHHRGISCKKTTPVGHRIISIPSEQFITSEMAREQSACCIALGSNGKNISQHDALALFLVQEKRLGIDSQWHPYLNVLPAAFKSHSPMFMSKSERRLLGSSMCALTTASAIKKMRTSYDDYCECVSDLADNVTFSEFLWGRNVALTRGFGIPAGVNGASVVALVPLADMLNHDNHQPSTRWSYDAATDSFVMMTAKRMRAGVPLTDSYGEKCNWRWFVNYGFTMRTGNDDFNTTLLAFSLGGGSDESMLIKRRLLGPVGGVDDGFSDLARANAGDNFKDRLNGKTAFLMQVPRARSKQMCQTPAIISLLTVLRIVAITDESELIRFEMDQLMRPPAAFLRQNDQRLILACENPLVFTKILPPISVENEIAAFDVLLKSCRRSLARFRRDSPKETDEERLVKAQESLDACAEEGRRSRAQMRVNILTQRLLEQEVLEWYIVAAEAVRDCCESAKTTPPKASRLRRVLRGLGDEYNALATVTFGSIK